MPTKRCRNEKSSARTGSTRRPALLAALFLLAELLALGLVACGGGGGDSGPTGPLLPWPRSRRNDNNTALAADSVGDNEGAARLIYRFDGETPSDFPPIVGRDSSIYLALGEGLLSLDGSDDEGDAVLRWPLVETCDLDDGQVPLQPVSSITINANGLDLIVGSAAGNVFRLREPDSGDEPPECLFAFPAGTRGSPLISIDGADLELLSFVVGTTSGRLTSVSLTGQRRWSFPEGTPFAGDISSSPAALGTGTVFASPDGGLHSVDQTGRPRWNVSLGGSYPAGEIIPSPAVLNQIFTVSPAGDVVAYSPGGSHLWTFSPDDDAKVVGSLAVSTLTTEGGTFIGENVVFALDSNGILYGIGSNTGELVQFCAADNRACLPSTCDDVLDPDTGLMEPAPCDEVRRCSETTLQPCGGEGDAPCPMGESCTDQFFCSNDPNRACGQDLCRTDTTGEDGLCRRVAKQPLSLEAAEFATSPLLSTDSFVVAATTDGRVCARRLDGSVPNGKCRVDATAELTNTDCTPDSCVAGDSCCDVGDTDCQRPGYCKNDSDRACTLDTCDDGQTCETIWQGGCVALGVEVGTSTLAPPVIDSRGGILVTTEQGLAIVQ